MMIEEAKRRLRNARYQVLEIRDARLNMVYWPPAGNNGEKHQEAMNDDRLLALAETIPVDGDESEVILDIRHVGIVGLLKQAPMTTDSEGQPTVKIVLEITGQNAVRSLPIEDIRDMLGERVLLQMNFVQTRLEIEPRRAASGQ